MIFKTPASVIISGVIQPPHFPAERQRGFCLAEITLALGLLAVAAAGLLTALPLALKHSADAARTGMAGLIAESLLAELDAFGELRAAADAQPADGAAAEFLALNDSGQILRVIDADLFTTGDRAAAFLAAIRREPERPGLVALSVTVEWPGAAPEKNRTRQWFGTLLAP